MCGIAGIIYRNGAQPHPIGRDMTRMLQSMKHRGPDSTGYALYGPASEPASSCATSSRTRTTRATSSSPTRLKRHQREVRDSAAHDSERRVIDVDEETEYAYRVTLEFDGELKALADYVEDVTDCEVLSLGHSLEIVKDLGDAESVADQYELGASRARTRSVTCGWRPSPTSTSPAPTRTGRTRSPTSRSSTTAS